MVAKGIILSKLNRLDEANEALLANRELAWCAFLPDLLYYYWDVLRAENWDMNIKWTYGLYPLLLISELIQLPSWCPCCETQSTSQQSPPRRWWPSGWQFPRRAPRRGEFGITIMNHSKWFHPDFCSKNHKQLCKASFLPSLYSSSQFSIIIHFIYTRILKRNH